MSNWNKYQEAYQKASSQVQDVLNSTILNDCVAKQVAVGNLPDTEFRSVAILFRDHIVGVLDKNAIETKLQSVLGPVQGNKILNEINECLRNKQTLTDSATLNFGEHAQTAPDNRSTEQSKISKSTTPASPLRTMATDIEKIHGYGAGTSSASEATTSQKAPQQDEEPVHTSSQESVLTHSTNTSPHGPAAPQPTQHVQPSTSNAAPVAEPAQPTPRPTAAAPSFTPTPPTTPTAPAPPAAPTSVAGTPLAPATPPTDLPTNGGNDMPSFTPTHTAPPAPQPRTDETGPAAPDTTPPDTRWG